MSPPAQQAAALAQEPRRRPSAVPTRIELSVLPGGRRSLRISPNRLRAILAATVILVAMAVVVGAQNLVGSQQLRLDQLEANLAAASTTEQRLELTVAQLQAPQRVVSTAERKLGMVVPNQLTYLEPISLSGSRR